MARNSFTTGFGAGLGVLFAILLFPFLLVGGCLLTVGSCGVAAIKSLPSGDVRPVITASPAEPTKPEVMIADAPRSQFSPDFNYELVSEHTHYPKSFPGGVYRATIFVTHPTKADLAMHAQAVYDSYRSWDHIEVAYFDDKRAAIAARVTAHGFGDAPDGLIPEWTFSHEAASYLYNRASAHTELLFRHEKSIADLPQGGSIEGDAALLLKSSENMASIEEERASDQKTQGKHLVEIDGKAADDAKQPQEVPAAANSAYRTWTSANGKFTTDAKLLSYANGTINIETRDSKKINVPLEKLSKTDQDFVTEWRRKH
jgi:hypothetical protein